jgi:hypothetical protein
MDILLHEIPQLKDQEGLSDDVESRPFPGGRFSFGGSDGPVNDETPLLNRPGGQFGRAAHLSLGELEANITSGRTDTDLSQTHKIDDPTKALAGLNALEIAAVANAKRFLSQRLVQKVVQDIWDGKIIFWENLSVDAVKKARVYNQR